MVSYEVMIKLIGATKTNKGLEVDCQIDKGSYKTGIKISDEKMENISISPSAFHGEWNYSISPQ